MALYVRYLALGYLTMNDDDNDYYDNGDDHNDDDIDNSDNNDDDNDNHQLRLVWVQFVIYHIGICKT